MTLSIDTIEAALPGATIRDKTVVGLHLRAFAGRKAFYLYYTTKTNVERKPKLGDYPTVSLTAARRIAKEMLVEVAAGRDPMTSRAADRASPFVKDLCVEYMARHGDAKKTASEDRRHIRDTIKPKLGKLKVADVRVTDVEDVFLGLKSTPSKANRFLATVSKMMSLAEKWEYRPLGSNPCRHILKFKEKKRHRYLTREEAARFIERLRFYTERYPEQAAFIWLLIYTGARPSEIAKLEPRHRSRAKMTLTEHKTGEKTGEDHVIHLPPQAVALLDRFPKRGIENAKGLRTLLGIESPRHLFRLIRVDTKIKNIHLYDLRHTFASIGLSHGLTLAAIGELMGHRDPRTTMRYAHLIDDVAQAAATQTADAFDAFSSPAVKALPGRKLTEPAP